MEQAGSLIIKPHAGFQEAFVSSNADIIFGAGGVGNGKAGLLDSCVVTPYGYRKVIDLKVGDIISNPDTGGQERIVYLHPIGLFPFYRISFSDGTHMDCSEGHLWKVRVNGRHTKRKGANGDFDDWRIWTAQKINEWMRNKKDGRYANSKLSIPLCRPVHFASAETPTTRKPIPPYVLGALLGDGCLTQCNNNRYIKLSSPDKHIADRFADYGYDMTRCRKKEGSDCIDYNLYGDILKDIRLLKLDGCHSDTKFIPRRYKVSSKEDRISIIQGLLDTDGYIDKSGHISYTTVSKQLAEDVAFIIRSLGGRASITTKESGYRDKHGKFVECKLAYNVWICTLFNDKLFTLPKKLERVKSYGYTSGKKLFLEKTIEDVEYLGLMEGRCISVDNPSGLYMVEDFSVTHNSAALALAIAEPLMLDGDFRALISRRSLQNQKQGGGFVDTFQKLFGNYCSIKQSDSPRVSFPSGAFCDLTYIDDTNLDKMRERSKGWQYDVIGIDELTEMPWDVFKYIASRNRGSSKMLTGRLYATFNPKRSHWTRQFVDWYVGVNGEIIPERNGRIRYFFVAGNNVHDVVWGDSKEEVYSKCKIQIDENIRALGPKFTYKNFIKSFVLFDGLVSENEALVGNNANYVGSVAMSGGSLSAQLLRSNYNADPDEDEHIPIPSVNARNVFMNDPCTNGDKWVTVDLADYGTDNLVAFAWNGTHAYDMLIIMRSTPRDNAHAVKIFAHQHGVADSHIIYDATSGRYFNDYIPDAVPYISNRKPYGMYALTAMTLKDMCYLRLCRMIKDGNISFDESLARRNYSHQNLKFNISVENEFIEECSVVRFDSFESGK
ncbi:MAG: hypothetical protein HUK08_05340, partial [Bacteroidaceae bacterium]|nr:hypothetical protein [Bacteroidaceae bacterium]